MFWDGWDDSESTWVGVDEVSGCVLGSGWITTTGKKFSGWYNQNQRLMSVHIASSNEASDLSIQFFADKLARFHLY